MSDTQQSGPVAAARRNSSPAPFPPRPQHFNEWISMCHEGGDDGVTPPAGPCAEEPNPFSTPRHMRFPLQFMAAVGPQDKCLMSDSVADAFISLKAHDWVRDVGESLFEETPEVTPQAGPCAVEPEPKGTGHTHLPARLLVEIGPQDMWLTGDTTVTFWKGGYRRHTNFVSDDSDEPDDMPLLVPDDSSLGLCMPLQALSYYEIGDLRLHGGGGGMRCYGPVYKPRGPKKRYTVHNSRKAKRHRNKRRYKPTKYPQARAFSRKCARGR